ncbi:hypothetical protein D2Q93_15775 [Alicyclobacillaceae bacterium I2511]|nr:hypothetical protein D2Q93_15775 [Alicyclobacillaceae bacterium I2511]
MHGIAFATFVGIIWFVNLFLTWLQIKQHKRLMRSLIHVYAGQPNIYLSSGAYRKFMRPMSNIFIVVDENYIVVDYRIKKGRTVFAQYHKSSEWIGRDVHSILTELEEVNHNRKSRNNTEIAAMIQACQQAVVMVRKEKGEENPQLPNCCFAVNSCENAIK